MIATNISKNNHEFIFTYINKPLIKKIKGLLFQICNLLNYGTGTTSPGISTNLTLNFKLE